MNVLPLILATAFSFGPRVGLFGDSISNSNLLTATEQVRHQLWLLMPTSPVDCRAVPGDSTSSVVSHQWPSCRDTPGGWCAARYSYFVILAGINDINFTADSGATIAARITGLADTIKAATSATVVILYLLPFGASPLWNAGRQTRLEDVNSALATYCAGTTRVVCVDTNTPMRDGGTPANLSASYDSGDGLHPNAAGTAYLAGLIYAAIGSLPVIVDPFPDPSTL